MDVRFSAEGEESVLMAMPIPKVDDDVREHMASYAPILHWEQVKANVQTMTVGATGDVWSEHPTETDTEYAARIAAEQAAAE
jgi:hypothetical protein